MEARMFKLEMTYPLNHLIIFLAISIILYYFLKPKHRPIYILDYACFKPPLAMRIPFHTFLEHSQIVFKKNPRSTRFQMRILERAGLGEETSLPPAVCLIPPQPTIQRARDETHLVIFTAIDELFVKTGLKPNDISVLVTNCNGFNPFPSLSSIIVRNYNMSSTIKSFSMSGMGCSASPIAINMGRMILLTQPDSYALVISTEIITPNAYTGSERSMLLPACLFRLGCSAILLTNKRVEAKRAKYKLLHLVQTNMAAQEKAYNSVILQEDDEGKVGISLSKDLMIVAGNALKSNISTIGPLVLPMSEKIRFVLNFLAQKILRPNKIKPYIPNFGKVISHFCVHSGGRAVIDEVQKGLQLSDHQIEASRMTLHRFGNTSSSSIWYELSYFEAKERVKKGDIVWQIAFGSGFKCNSIILKCHRDINVEIDGYGPWKDSINKYPVIIPEILKL